MHDVKLCIENTTKEKWLKIEIKNDLKIFVYMCTCVFFYVQVHMCVVLYEGQRTI